MRLLAVLAAASLVLAGCGDDEDGEDAGEDTTEAADLEASESSEADDGGGAGGETEPEGFDVQLTGTAEVPGPGDEEGTGAGEVVLGDGEACTEVEIVLEEPPQAMHIHEGTVDESGPVVVDFGEPTRDDGWSVCVEADQAVLDDIAADPDAYYLNVHNEPFPEGAVRSQLGRSDGGG
jgi:hypothetical protein